jgi:hypothetical protein
LEVRHPNRDGDKKHGEEAKEIELRNVTAHELGIVPTPKFPA